ncbi:MAG: hypothetical protein JSW20_08440 [Nitrospiraceae bacterium]|nr:MAG: hypothetical protein JSW20_08440 [Nitrospiraceae bacterium]
MILKTINKTLYLAMISLSLISLVSCALNSYVKKGSSFNPDDWDKIIVFPFTGSRGFTYLATEAFTFHIKAKDHFMIIPAETAYASIKELGVQVEDNFITIENARLVAQHLDAQALILGNIKTLKKGKSIDAVASVKVIDVKTGQIVTESYRPSNLKVKRSEEQCVIISVSNASVDINEFLVETAGKKKTGMEQNTTENDITTFKDLDESL